MEPGCRKIVKVILPAVRASLAETMNTKYGWTQSRTASELGVVQVAISKYLNHKYSGDVLKVKKYIDSEKIVMKLADDISKGKGSKEAAGAIDRLCEKVMFDLAVN